MPKDIAHIDTWTLGIVYWLPKRHAQLLALMKLRKYAFNTPGAIRLGDLINDAYTVI